MSVDKEALEEIALQYHLSDTVEDMFIENICQEYTYPWIREGLSDASRVLELGYGDGLVTKDLIEQGHDVTVVEGAKSIAAAARAKWGSRVRIQHALFEEFTTEERFDAVLATHVLEHIDDPVALLRRLARWLSPSGRGIVIVPNCESIHRQLAVRMGLQPTLDTLGERDHLVGHQRVYSLSTLRRDVEAAGLAVVAERGFFLKVLPNSMMLDYRPDLLLALNDMHELLPARYMANIGVVARCS